MASGIPFALLLFKGLPRGGPGAPSVPLYAAVLLAFALLKAWPAPAFNNPAFAGGSGGLGKMAGRAVGSAECELQALALACSPAPAEIVPARQRNLVYAFDRCFEGERGTQRCMGGADD